MKRFIIILFSLFYILHFVFFSFFLYNDVKNIYETDLLEKEVLSAYELIENNKTTYDDFYKKIDKNMTSNSNLIIELAIENYLKDVLKTMVETKKIENYLLDTEVTTIDNLDVLEQYKDELNNLKTSINNINKDSYIKSQTSNEKIIQKYNKISSYKISLEEESNLIDSMSFSVDKIISIASFLKTNESSYKIENNMIVFLNRNTYNLYKSIVDDITSEYIINLIDYKLIDDKVGPVIDATNVNILLGTNYNFNNNIKCYDEVDGNVQCNVTGSYNVNEPGKYAMKINAEDLSGNISNKEIIITVNEPEKPTGPYYIEIIRNHNTVIVYGLDNFGDYTEIVQVFPASVGAGTNTPIGTFKTTRGLEWGALYGGVFGQYSTRIVGSILFHSVPYFSIDKSTLWWEEYNRLGTARSLGCIRLTVSDAKWIYDNCPSGTTVKIYDGALPNGVSKPSAPKIDPNDPNRGWDPTDPDPANPWNN